MSRAASIIASAVVAICLAHPAMAQWTSRPSLRTVLQSCNYGEGTLCVCRHGAFVQESGELRPLTRSTGLSSAYVSAGAASENTIAIAYEDGSIDIFCNGRKSRVDDATYGSLPQSRKIRAMSMGGGLLAASGDFGISLIDPADASVLSACDFGQPVTRCSLQEGKAIASTPLGTYSISAISPYFQDPQMWQACNFTFVSDCPSYEGPCPESPPSDFANFMASSSGNIAIASSHFCEISKNSLSSIPNPDGADFTCAFYNPYNPSHIFLGDSNGTLFEYMGRNLKARHSGRVGGPIVGMECTPEGDLLILSRDKACPVAIFDHNGAWHQAATFKKMGSAQPLQLLKVSDYVFAVCMGANGIFAADLAGTPLDFADDSWASFYPEDGSRIGNSVNCIAVDTDGRLLAGTSKGVAFAANAASIAHSAPKFARPVVTEPLGAGSTYSQYLLSSRNVTGIAVDAAGRKWISTSDAGVFLLSSGMDEEVMRLNERNSLLPSDSVSAINIVQATGEVFFATRNGLASYMSDIQEASDDLSKVMVYPNPVRPGYEGPISVSGLEDGCDVRISDVAGNLAFSCQSQGGRVEWDGQNLKGNPCATGVYLIFIVNPASGHKAVKKLLIVR